MLQYIITYRLYPLITRNNSMIVFPRNTFSNFFSCAPNDRKLDPMETIHSRPNCVRPVIIWRTSTQARPKFVINAQVIKRVCELFTACPVCHFRLRTTSDSIFYFYQWIKLTYKTFLNSPLLSDTNQCYHVSIETDSHVHNSTSSTRIPWMAEKH